MTHAVSPATRTLDLDFLYIDLTSCTRCRGDGREPLPGARRRPVGPVVGGRHRQPAQGAGRLRGESAQASSRELAHDPRERARRRARDEGEPLRLVQRPRRTGHRLPGLWTYEGAEYTEAPEALLVDAILRAAYAAAPAKAEPQRYAGVPENLLRFFAAKAATAALCCPSTGDGACCGAEVKVPPSVSAAAATSKASGCGCGTAAAA